ncbi:hypothetical protein AB0M95_14975 [Sphaerisporangium sp. NPDC051017]|uniref:hypothetical protein n=1 Tax=Sphaerisporangium sp. NPDC051017 TaxID=3154636 RepID=UPI003437CD0B
MSTFRTRLASGEKPCRKRMATLTVVYDAAPAPRCPHDVIAPPGGRGGTRPLRPGPKASGTWLYGSVAAGPEEVIATMFDHAEARDPFTRGPGWCWSTEPVISSTSSAPKPNAAPYGSTSSSI